MKNVVLVIGWLVLLCGCGGMPDTLVGGGYDEAKMEAAIERAKDEVDSFIKVMKKGGGTDFSVKAPVVDGENTEHFWLTDIEYADGQFTGKIGNDPGMVTNVAFGQEWTIEKSEISDWMYMKNGKMYGNYTIRPLLETMSEEEAAGIRSILADE